MTVADQTQPVPPHFEPPISQPTPEWIDRIITEYLRAQERVREAETIADNWKKSLTSLVDHHGHVPPHAEQSKRLAGRHNVATLTRGTTVSVNEPSVTQFLAYLSEQGYADLFPRFFAAQTKHVLVEGARDVLKTLKLARRVEEKIASLFGKAFDVKSKSPSLKVELVAAEKPQRKPRGKKAA
jgi:hypothetical protein